jgi:hypothetical protein
VIGSLMIAGLLGPGCKKKQQEQQTQYPPQTVYVPDAGATTTPPPPPPPSDAAAATDGPLPLDLITTQALQASIKERAKKEARGLKPQGDFFGGVVQEGGSAQQTIMIDSGKCYGVVAQGGTGITELDIQIQARPGFTVPLPGPVIAVDSTSGPQAAVSPCWKNPFPLGFPAVVVIKATRGGGPVGAQIFVK